MLRRSLFYLLLPAILLPTLPAQPPARSAGPPAAQAAPALPQSSAHPDPRNGYARDAACVACHQQQASYLHTAHHLTSQAPSRHSILGSFAPGANILTISSQPRLSFEMDDRPDGFYETAVAEKGAEKLQRAERIDVVIGSGVRGQTFLYWHGDQLFELPVSDWTSGRQWINSPGYQDGTANFGRRADPRCMECHAAYLRALSPDPQANLYDPTSLLPGIACETCHGPGANHAALEHAAPGRPASSAAILNPAHFPRDRQVDLCALCHNGTSRQELLPAFSYRPGQPLDDVFAPAPLAAEEQLDVHANQVGMLQQSRCYRASAMTCSTCHDVHAAERPAAAYSDRCLRCHRWQSCGLARARGPRIAANCVDCHMPLQTTRAIVSVTAGRVLHTAIRNHRIAIYPGS